MTNKQDILSVIPNTANPKTWAQANVLLQELIVKIERYSSDTSNVYYIERAWVFGSYLYKNEGINDLDIFVEWNFRYSKGNSEYDHFLQTKIKNVPYPDMMSCKIHAVRYLMDREGFISLHNAHDEYLFLHEICSKELIYEY